MEKYKYLLQLFNVGEGKLGDRWVKDIFVEDAKFPPDSMYSGMSFQWWEIVRDSTGSIVDYTPYTGEVKF